MAKPLASLTALAAVLWCIPALPAQAPQPAPQAQDFPFLGLQTRPGGSAGAQSGLVVTFVYPESAAEAMGFQLGDEIRLLNDLLITDQKSFVDELRENNIGARLRFVVRRGGDEKRLTGRIGSYRKTMTAYQKALRKEYMGKPLPELPGVRWWKPETKTWEAGEGNWKDFLGKVTVVFSVDDCRSCKLGRLAKMVQVQKVMAVTAPDAPVGFAAVYYDERPGKAGVENNCKAAGKLFAEASPAFAAGVAFYPSPPPSARQRGRQMLIHHHGLAVLDKKGRIIYLQIFGLPAMEFLQAYQKALQDAGALPSSAGKPPAGTKPPGPGAGKAAEGGKAPERGSKEKSS